MSRILAICLAAVFALPAQAKLPGTWEEIIKSPKFKKSPTQEQAHIRAVRPSGDFQLYKVADRYGFLFDPDGYPVVVFDYTMDPMSLKELALGGIGIGKWSLRNLWNKYKKIKENPKDILETDQFMRPGEFPALGADDDAQYGEFYKEFAEAEANSVSPSELEEIERGIKEFGKLRFNDEWIAKHQNLQAAGSEDKRSGFKPASFAMSDLYIESKNVSKVHEAMNQFSILLFRKPLKLEETNQFLKQFKMAWQEDKKEFKLIWSPEASGLAEKAPPVPGFVLYYYDIYNILAFKYALYNMDRNVAYLEVILGKYGSILGIFVSRITNGVRSQMDSHENGLLTLFEAFLRGEYTMNIPWEDPASFVDQSITLLYLNKMIETEDITDGGAKRSLVQENEAKAKEDILKWLAKKKYTIQEWSDGRAATVYKGDKKKGIVSLTIGRHWLSRQPSFLHYEQAPWLKSAYRVLLETFVDGVRFVMPTQLNLGKWLSKWFAINIQIYVPSFFWDGLFRGRQFTEIAYEGDVFIKVNEAIDGRWVKVPGYSGDELVALKGVLASQRMNAFEVPLKYEDIAIKTNYKLVLDLIGQGMTDYRHAIP